GDLRHAHHDRGKDAAGQTRLGVAIGAVPAPGVVTAWSRIRRNEPSSDGRAGTAEVAFTLVRPALAALAVITRHAYKGSSSPPPRAKVPGQKVECRARGHKLVTTWRGLVAVRLQA